MTIDFFSHGFDFFFSHGFDSYGFGFTVLIFCFDGFAVLHHVLGLIDEEREEWVCWACAMNHVLGLIMFWVHHVLCLCNESSF